MRAPDAPVFGIDVALQKARTAAFFSGAYAGNDLAAAGMGGYVGAARAFVGQAMLTGAYAFTDRANGNLSRPYYPDGIDGTPNGPFSNPINQWSIFTDGLQLDLVAANIVQHVGLHLRQQPRYGSGLHRGGAAAQRHPDFPRQRADLPRFRARGRHRHLGRRRRTRTIW